MYVSAFNPTDRPVVVDDHGRTLGGGEWGVVWRSDDHVEAAVADARLVLVPTVNTPDADPDARDAVKRAGETQKRHERLDALDKDRLVDLAAELGDAYPSGPVDRDDPPHKDELVRNLALVDVDVPAAPAAESAEPAESKTRSR